jgi:hypothetical protein
MLPVVSINADFHYDILRETSYVSRRLVSSPSTTKLSRLRAIKEYNETSSSEPRGHGGGARVDQQLWIVLKLFKQNLLPKLLDFAH